MSGHAFIGFGSRDGDRRKNMTDAARLLTGSGVRIEEASSLYETQPVNLPGDRPLLNAVARVRTDLPPRLLLEACLRAEKGLGRQREKRPGGEPDTGHRPIDLDLLLYGEQVIEARGLVLPHPRLHLRRFVLVPLAEIAPGARHPVLGEAVATLLARCTDLGWVRPLTGASSWWKPGVTSRVEAEGGFG